MRYFGGKQRIAKPLTKFINEKYLKDNRKPFVDLFCGSCNVSVHIDSNRVRYANDIHKYLIAMWRELQKGWLPPKICTEEQYKYVKEHLDDNPCMSGFIGFGCSYSGKWWGGLARDKAGMNYCLTPYNSTLKKLEKLKDVIFTNSSYKNVKIPNGSIVYCDIPYRNTTQYSKKECGVFNHEEFYKWVEDNKYKFTILISEYKQNVPDGFDIVWEIKSKKSIRDKNYVNQQTVEVLITPKI